MPLSTDTATALGFQFDGNMPRFPRCESRSLVLDRCADPSWKDKGEKTPRRNFFREAMSKRPLFHKCDAYQRFLAQELSLQPDHLLFAQLQSRLMVNMAGGVMANAGLCLDRFGLPCIPGSAVKGCARRAALVALREWGQAGGQLQHRPSALDNPLSAACAPFDSSAVMLSAIARVFGWCEQDWSLAKKDGRYVADFAWACGDALEANWKAAAERLAKDFGWRTDDKHHSAPWKSLPNFAGSVAFLPAYLVDIPAGTDINGTKTPQLGKLELDVVTCHHRDYYDRTLPVATDTEEPVPVVFPAVAPGHVFGFALKKLRRCTDDDLPRTRVWLQVGLEIFGLGAKTNAGYGWFDCSDAVQKSVQEALDAAKSKREQDEREAKERTEREAARATLEPDPALLAKFQTLKEADLRGQINPFATEERFWTQKDERVQLTLLHFLEITAPELLAADRANPKSKIAKAIANLGAKFPHVARTQS